MCCRECIDRAFYPVGASFSRKVILLAEIWANALGANALGSLQPCGISKVWPSGVSEFSEIPLGLSLAL